MSLFRAEEGEVFTHTVTVPGQLAYIQSNMIDQVIGALVRLGSLLAYS